MQAGRYSLTRGLRAGAVGGFVGSGVLGALAGLGAVAPNQEVFYVSVAKALGLGSPDLTGWALHFLTGTLAGAVFIGITGLISKFALDTKRKSVWVGLLGGIGVWVVVYVPVTSLFVPADLSNLMFAGGSLIFHLVYGIVTALVSLSLIRRNIMTKTATT
jgi:hypothetical protein